MFPKKTDNKEENIFSHGEATGRSKDGLVTK